MAIPEVDKSLTKALREIPEKGKSENGRINTGDLWWAWVDLNHRPRPYQGLLWCYMHSSVAMITLLMTSIMVTSWHDCWFQVARSVQSGDHFLQADLNEDFTGLIPPWKPDSTPVSRQSDRNRIDNWQEVQVREQRNRPGKMHEKH